MLISVLPYKSNPLKEGQMNARCNFRSIVRHEDMYHIFEEDHIYGHWRIFKRLSTDGIHMGPRTGPLLRLGRKGEFDEIGNADPTVIYNNGWHMWFDGFDATLHWDWLGYATSEDGENWEKYGPVLKRGDTGEWDSKSIHHPVCLRHGSKYYLYYSGCRDDIYNVKNIGLALSEDGISWNKVPENPILTFGQEGEFDYKYIRPSLPVYIGDRWFMFYWGFDGHNHSMGLAMSEDLIVWDKVSKLLSGTNEHDGITASQPLFDQDNKVRLWYATFDNCNIHRADVITE